MSKEPSFEEFVNGLVELCNRTRVGVAFHISQLGWLPEGKFVSYFGRDEDMNIIPQLTDVDMSKLFHLPDETDK